MPAKQYRKVGCLDLNADSGCGFEVRAESDEEVLRVVADHGKTAHRMTSIPPEMTAAVKAAIRSVTVEV